MDQLTLFSIASQRTAWLGNRQSVVAENVANANTPGYTAKDITPFSEVFDQTSLKLSGSSPMHLAANGGYQPAAAAEAVEAKSWDVKHSGNSVSLEQEMLKAGEIAREYSLDTSVVKAFHRMLVMSVKS